MDLKFFKTIAYCYRAVSQNYWVNRALETYDAVFLALTDLRMPKDPNKPDIVSNSNIVSGNIIGLNAAGSAKLANSYGVFINTGSNNTIGGTTAAIANTIARNGSGGGVVIVGNTAGNRDQHGHGSHDGIGNGRDIMGGTSDAVSSDVYHRSGSDVDSRRHCLDARQFGEGKELERRSEREDL